MSLIQNFQQWRPHPWHGISAGKNPPVFVNAYIEITPFDGVKYEIDKETGYLKVDRPQVTSALPPALYGFVPRTYCGDLVGKLSPGATRGDGDPLDICVLSERAIGRSEVVVPCRIIGGLRMLDRGEADDKIVAVLDNDPFWANVPEIGALPPILMQRLQHYFLTYKLIPGQGQAPVKIDEVYGLETAKRVVEASLADYQAGIR
jgi:inorganic pyrophosphatase